MEWTFSASEDNGIMVDAWLVMEFENNNGIMVDAWLVMEFENNL